MSEFVSDALGAAMAKDDFANNTIDSPIPTGLRPFSHFIHVMTIAPRKQSKGGIIIPDDRRDGEAFMNNIGRIAAIGPAAFRTNFWRERGYQRNDITEPGVGEIIDAKGSLPLPTVGSFVRMSGVRNRAFKFKEVWITEIEDYNIRSIVDKEEAYDYRFWN